MEPKDNVRYLPVPDQLTDAQFEHWHDQAAYWALTQENAQRAVEYAARQQEAALRMLGMIGLERGLPDGAA